MKKVKVLFVMLVLIVTTILLSGCGCKHEWKEASCVSPEICLICQKTKGKTTGHSWEEASCIAPKTCTVCFLTEGESKEHNYIDGVCEICKNEDPITLQKKSGKIIYDNLTMLNIGLDQQASAIYEAWYFSIYKADDDDYLRNFDKALTDFANVTGVKKTVAKKYIEEQTKNVDSKYGKNIVYLAALGTTDIAVGIVSYAYEEAGLNEINAKILEEAKKKLKDMDTQYEDETLYSILKEYYTNSMSYYNFVVSPSGSFSQLSSTINGYKSTIEKNKQELSFIYEE